MPEHITLPDGCELELKEFAPCVVEDGDLCTTMLLRDCMTIWAPFAAAGLGHVVDLGYDDQGDLIGIKIWASVAKRSAK